MGGDEQNYAASGMGFLSWTKIHSATNNIQLVGPDFAHEEYQVLSCHSESEGVNDCQEHVVFWILVFFFWEYDSIAEREEHMRRDQDDQGPPGWFGYIGNQWNLYYLVTVYRVYSKPL